MKRIFTPHFSGLLRVFAMIVVLCSGNFVPLMAQEIFFVTYKNVTYFCLESMTCSTVEGLKSTGQAVYDTYYDCTALGGGIGEITVYGIAPKTDGGSFNPVEPDPFGFYTPPAGYDSGGGGVNGNYQDYFTQPRQIVLSTMTDQQIQEEILKWFQWFCVNKETVNASVSMMTNIDAIPHGGIGGPYVNGYGVIDGIPVRWQINVSPEGYKNDQLLPSWKEGYGYAYAYYCFAGLDNERRITLTFSSESERRNVISRKAPCFFDSPFY